MCHWHILVGSLLIHDIILLVSYCIQDGVMYYFDERIIFPHVGSCQFCEVSPIQKIVNTFSHWHVHIVVTMDTRQEV